MYNTSISAGVHSRMAQGLFFNSTGIAKTKYEAKATIIKEADDLTTQDKLDAFDVASIQYYLDIIVCLCITGSVICLLKKAG